MNYNLDIQKLLLKTERLDNHDDKIALLKQAINIADANNDIDWGFDLRLDLIREETYTSHCTESFPAFAWVLNAYDNNPELIDESSFLWKYKWMASSAKRNINISRQQIEGIMDDLRIRMKRNGYTDSAYYTIALYWHLFLGDIDKAHELIKLRDETPRDSMSHCAACELDASVEMELIDGNIDKAITLAYDLVTKKLTCGHMPFGTFCNLTYYLNKAKDARADEYFAKAVEEMESMEHDTSLLSDIGLLMHYLSDNDKEKGWLFFEKYSEWEINAEDAISFDFALAALHLLKGESGNKELKINTRLPFYKSDNVYNIQEIYDFYLNKAEDLAQRFDLRNDNTYFSHRLQKTIS